VRSSFDSRRSLARCSSRPPRRAAICHIRRIRWRARRSALPAQSVCWVFPPLP
jgi:hypothetical protein